MAQARLEVVTDQVADTPPTKTYTWTTIKQMVDDGKAVVVVEGKVYDITDWVDEHPGGGDVVLETCGMDGTEDYEAVGHSDEANEMLPDYYIGDLDVAED